jgi:hypothetical protein
MQQLLQLSLLAPAASLNHGMVAIAHMVLNTARGLT